MTYLIGKTNKMPAYNERFGATAAGRADLKGSAKNRRCAKPPSRCRQVDDSAVERVPSRKESATRQRSGQRPKTME